MTPTPEDIRLAEELTECWWLNKEKAQAIIAAHTAPLRELAEIGRLAVEDRTKALATGKAPEHRKQSTYLDYTKAHVALAQSCDAYLAKQEESK